MRLCNLLGALALAPFAWALWAAAPGGGPDSECRRAEQLPLCEALGRVRPGESLPVVVSGVYVLGPEHQLLYDPQEPACSQDLQPATWVEFAGAANSQKLEEILKNDGRASVVFEGRLAGPKAAGEDNPDLPVNIAYANRAAGARYGHHGGFRTRLTVVRVVSAEQVSEFDSWQKVQLHGGDANEAAVQVGESDILQYPPRARRLGVEGDVVLEAAFVQGAVGRVEVQAGDRLLADEAVRNLKTWRLREPVDAILTVVFSFKLEDRLRGDSQAPTIVLQLPRRVTVVAPSYRW